MAEHDWEFLCAEMVQVDVEGNGALHDRWRCRTCDVRVDKEVDTMDLYDDWGRPRPGADWYEEHGGPSTVVRRKDLDDGDEDCDVVLVRRIMEM